MKTASANVVMNKAAALLAELEAALLRESFWIARGDTEALTEALPAKAELIRTLGELRSQAGPAVWQSAGYEARLREAGRSQQENARLIGERLQALRPEIDAVNGALGRLRRFGRPVEAAAARLPARWA